MEAGILGVKMKAIISALMDIFTMNIHANQKS